MHKMFRLRVFWPPRLAPYLNRAATERMSLRSSPDNNDAKQIVRWKLARIICSMCPMSTHTHHGAAAVAELPAPRRTSSSLSCAAQQHWKGEADDVDARGSADNQVEF
jgi:hypothetical protein